MSIFSKIKKESQTKANQVLDAGASKLESLQTEYGKHFYHSSLSAASEAFKNDPSTLMKATLSTTLDAISSISQDGQTLETFLHLHIPQMEDGNNFGVTVQLSLLKQISELQEACSKAMDELSGFASAKADAYGKCNLPSSSTTITKAKTSSTSNGDNSKDGKVADTKEGESTEEKQITTTAINLENNPEHALRMEALVAVDVKYYAKAQRAYQSILTTYIAVLDFMDKNKDKLEKPKGSGGSHSGFASMY